MAKLTVRNVGPIREAELEVKKHTVFIGPQGTGKSTLAKLIAIGSDYDVVKGDNTVIDTYGIENYFLKKSYISLIQRDVKITYEKGKFDIYPIDGQEKQLLDAHFDKTSEKIISTAKQLDKIFSKVTSNDIDKDQTEYLLNKAEKIVDNLINFLPSIRKPLENMAIRTNTIYIPAERGIITTLSNSIWSILNHDISLPKIVKAFANRYEISRKKGNKFYIPFLSIKYIHSKGNDKISFQKNSYVDIENSASGYQSVIPLLVVTEAQRRLAIHRFIVEEPELNLYPTAQKDLIYSLIGGLQPDVSYQDAEWVITTHSPYVLSSFNTLMLAYKVGNQSEELRAEVEKIIPSRCWINPNEFAAYYVDNGTVRNIVNEQTGLIADNELDDVSDDLADEQDKLFALRRSVTRA